MTVSEKAAYLKGLAEGLDLEKGSKEEKLFTAIIDLLGDIADEIEGINDGFDELVDEIDAVSDDLEDLETCVFDGGSIKNLDEDDDACDDECLCGCDDEYDEEPVFYTVKCPKCGNEITVDEDVLGLGAVNCPSCSELLEFDLGGSCEGCCCGDGDDEDEDEDEEDGDED